MLPLAPDLEAAIARVAAAEGIAPAELRADVIRGRRRFRGLDADTIAAIAAAELDCTPAELLAEATRIAALEADHGRTEG